MYGLGTLWILRDMKAVHAEAQVGLVDHPNLAQIREISILRGTQFTG